VRLTGVVSAEPGIERMTSSVISRTLSRDRLTLRPTVGALMVLCEENYARLSRLAPNLPERSGSLISKVEGGVDLFLEVEAQARYTTEIRLTYRFDGQTLDARGAGAHFDPDARIRAYHDARQVEVLDLRQTALPRYAHYDHPALDAKWRVNLFLSKWLAYCVSQGHRFGAAEPRGVDRRGDALLPSCG
jgi:uncharacterized protein YqiB (DUF1249 family)